MEKVYNSIQVDFSKPYGKIKPFNAINNGVAGSRVRNYSNHDAMCAAKFPYSRNHDASFQNEWLVDVHRIFRDFDADENDPNSYDFVFTDWLMEQLIRQDCEPIFRLGVTIENAHMMKSYNIYPPKDPHKWACICEHIIRHYNQGWANGYRWGIEYWEIWNEPDDCWKEETSAMWKGTKEQ